MGGQGPSLTNRASLSVQARGHAIQHDAFTTIAAVIGEPIAIPSEIDRGSLLLYKSRVQSILQHLTDDAEGWAVRLRAEGSRAQPPTINTLGALRKSA